MNNIELRRVYDTDIDSIKAIYAIIKECGEKMFLEDGLLHWADPLPVEQIKEECLTKEVYLVLDKATKRSIATYNITNKPSPYFEIEKKAVYFQRLAVSPELWRNGIGSEILNLVVDKARNEDMACVRSTVYSESKVAIGFSKKNGFKNLYNRPSKNFILTCMEKMI